MQTDVECAYAAGLIDGEGSVCATRKSNKQGQFNYGLVVVVSMTTREPLIWLLEHFGGGLSEPKTRAKLGPNCKPQSIWYVSGREAADFLRLIVPYLTIKKRRAEIGIKLGSTTNTRVNAKGYRGYRPLTDEVRKEREELAMLIRGENLGSNPATRRTHKWGPA